jgi:hypothetical protein
MLEAAAWARFGAVGVWFGCGLISRLVHVDAPIVGSPLGRVGRGSGALA